MAGVSDARLILLRKLAMALAVLSAVVAVGTLGFCLIGGRSFVVGLYLTLITVSTLGMRGSASPLTGAEQIWVMVLIVVGIGSAMVALTLVVGAVVEGHMRSILGRRKVNMKIASLNDHTVVCGYGKMGRLVCSHLRLRQTPVVIIDQNPDATLAAERDGFLYVLGDATDETILRDAGIARAKALVTLLETDASNVFVTLVARDLNSKIFIAARAEIHESESRLMRAGADKAICPQVIGATRLANVLTRPSVVDFIDFASEGLDLEAEQFAIEEGSKLVGQTLRQANLPREIGVLVIALKRANGKTMFNPDPDVVLDVGDTMVLTGKLGSMAELSKRY